MPRFRSPRASPAPEASRAAGAPVAPADAAVPLADWGFLANPDLPDRPGPAHLFVALRPAPTLRHYDPELVEYWVTHGGRGRGATLTRVTPMPIDREFSWGMIRLVDRLGVTNEYLTFGGQLVADLLDDAVVAVFTSPAPLLRRGGHSQGWDAGASDLGAFFGRLMVAVDFAPGFEGAVAAADPITRYAAFVADLVARYRRSVALRTSHPGLWALLAGEERRLQRNQAAAWGAGLELVERALPARAAGSARSDSHARGDS